MSSKTVKELKYTAKELGLKGYSKLRKLELIKMIEDYKHNESTSTKNLGREIATLLKIMIVR